MRKVLGGLFDITQYFFLQERVTITEVSNDCTNTTAKSTDTKTMDLSLSLSTFFNLGIKRRLQKHT